MRILSDTTDLTFSDDMDFIVDSDTGDFRISTELTGEVTTQMVIKRIFSSSGDWKIHPQCGANLSAFRGFPLDSGLITLIKSRIVDELTREFLFHSGKISVKVIPLTKNLLTVIIIVRNPYMKQPVVVSSSLSLDTYTPISNKAIRN